MKHLLIVLLLTTILACTETNSNPSANISGILKDKANSNLTSGMDSLYLPLPGNGVKQIQPQKDFVNNFELFQQLLKEFKYVKTPFELDGLIIDRTDEDWAKIPNINEKFSAYLIDAKDFITAKKVVSPLDAFEDFYKVYPIAKLGEEEYYYTLIYLVRYLDGNGQQDFFYLTTYNSNGVFLSGIEVGALEASSQAYIKTAQIGSDNIIKVQYSNYDEQVGNWVKKKESQYFLDNTGEVYTQYENKILGSSKGDDDKVAYSAMKTSDFANYFQQFQKEIRNNTPITLVNYITFPHFRVSYEEHYQDFQTKSEFLAQYETIFNESLRKKIIRQSVNELIVKQDEIGLSDGSIWFKCIGKDNDGRLIVAIRVN